MSYLLFFLNTTVLFKAKILGSKNTRIRSRKLKRLNKSLLPGIWKVFWTAPPELRKIKNSDSSFLSIVY